MPVRKRTNRLKAELDDETVEWLAGGEDPLLAHSEGELEAIWEEHRDRVLAEHVAASPGTRHPRWWDYDAPKIEAPGLYYDGKLAQHRRQLSGSGHQYQTVVPRSHCGIPHLFDVDPDNPPIFESEAAYLDRHGLLTAAERRRLKPADFDPVTLVADLSAT